MVRLQTTRLDGRLTDKPQDKPTCNKPTSRFNLTGQKGNESPSDDEKSDIPTWSTSIIEHEVRRHLHKNISDEKDGKTEVVLSCSEFEIFNKTLKFCSGVVVSKLSDANIILHDRHTGQCSS